IPRDGSVPQRSTYLRKTRKSKWQTKQEKLTHRPKLCIGQIFDRLVATHTTRPVRTLLAVHSATRNPQELNMAQQVDFTPSTPGNTTALHVHVPSGQSASATGNPSDFPNVSAKAATPGGKALKASVPGTPGQVVRLANPA